MAFPIVVPRLGWSMEEGTFVQWLKHEGEPVRAGELLFVLEGDKSAQDIESVEGGILRIPPGAPKAGEVVAVGALLGYLLNPGEPAPWETGQGAAEVKAAPAAAAAAHGNSTPPTPAPAPSAAVAERTTPAISPRARRAAEDLGVEWTQLKGSGKTGRIRERDVRAAAVEPASAAAAPPGSAGRLLPLTPTRRVVAERMMAGAHTTAPVTLTTRADATNLVGLRNQFKAAGDTAVPAFSDFLLKLTALALGEHPLLNSSWTDEGIRTSEAVHVGLAVDTESGLMVPVVRDVQALGLREIAARSREAIEQARARRLTPEQMQGGTFTVTNLGMYGIDAFTPILNLPQSAILGLGRIHTEPAVVNGQVVPREILTLSLTFDHRVVDGAPAARFLDTLRKYVEQPAPWLMR